MRHLATSILIGAGVVGYQATKAQPPAPAAKIDASQAAATTYEHLATAIIEIEATEDELLKSILIGYESAAQAHLSAALHDAKARGGHLEAAAAEVANIANEGDKRIQAIRQRLAKAGHTHNTDVETKEDYFFVTNKEKKGLVDLASRIGRAAGEEQIKGLADDLSKSFQAAISAE